mgnify:CR=1 FL=1
MEVIKWHKIMIIVIAEIFCFQNKNKDIEFVGIVFKMGYFKHKKCKICKKDYPSFWFRKGNKKCYDCEEL